MKPETHALVGLAIGAGLAHHQPIVGRAIIVGAAFLGSITPDLPLFAMVKCDDWAHRPRFSLEKEGTAWFLAKEISHSPLLWLTSLLIGWIIPWPHVVGLTLLAFSLGILSHWIIDLFTHCGAPFIDTDQSLIWPIYYVKPRASFPGNIPKLGYIVGQHVCGWEYRYNYKAGEDVSKTKLPERIVQLAAFILFAILVVWWK